MEKMKRLSHDEKEAIKSRIAAIEGDALPNGESTPLLGNRIIRQAPHFHIDDNAFGKNASPQ